MTIGEKIREQRKRRKMTMQELGALSGISKQAIYKYEKNLITNLPLDRVESIANALMISPSYLMGWTDNPDEKTATTDSDGLSPTDELLVMMFNNLSDEGKAKVIRLMKEITDKNK